MENSTIIRSTVKKLKVTFYSSFAVLVALCVLGFSIKLPAPTLEPATIINLQQLVILSLLGGIPGVLVWSRNKMKTLVELNSMEERLKKYVFYVWIRQSVFFFLAFFVLIMHVLTHLNHAAMLLGVIFLLSMFIVPSKSRLESETALSETFRDTDQEDDLDESSSSDSKRSVKK